jgi:hypothetical protein
MSITVATTHAVCFSATEVDAKDLWMNHQDLLKNTTAWSVHYKREHQDQQFGKQGAAADGGSSWLQVHLTVDSPQTPYRNRNVFKYAGLTSLRRDIWQVLYASAFVVIALHLVELIREQGLALSVPYLFLIYINVLSLYANENIGYVYECALFWWADDLRRASFNWMLMKGGLMASLGVVLHRVSKVDLRL